MGIITENTTQYAEQNTTQYTFFHHSDSSRSTLSFCKSTVPAHTVLNSAAHATPTRSLQRRGSIPPGTKFFRDEVHAYTVQTKTTSVNHTCAAPSLRKRGVRQSARAHKSERMTNSTASHTKAIEVASREFPIKLFLGLKESSLFPTAASPFRHCIIYANDDCKQQILRRIFLVCCPRSCVERVTSI